MPQLTRAARAALFACVLLVSLFLAGVGTRLFFAREVDVSIDIVSAVEAPPTLRALDGDSDLPPIPMERIDPRFSPRRFIFKLEAASTGRPSTNGEPEPYAIAGLWKYRYSLVGQQPGVVRVPEAILAMLADGTLDRVEWEGLALSQTAIFVPPDAKGDRLYRVSSGEGGSVSLNIRDALLVAEITDGPGLPSRWRGLAIDNSEQSLPLMPKKGFVRELSTGEADSILLRSPPDRRLAEKLIVSLRPAGHAARYYGRIPVRQLTRYGVALADRPDAKVLRLFVGLIQPKVYERSDRTEPEHGVEFERSRVPVPGRVDRFEDWRPEIGADGMLRLPGARFIESQPWAIFALCFSMLLLLAFSFIVGLKFALTALRWLSNAPEESTSREIAPFNLRVFLGYLVPLVMVWSFALAVFFPGSMSDDSMKQWSQAQGVLGLNDAHPIFHTLSIRWITKIWYSPAAVVTAHILLMSLSAAWAMSLLTRLGVRRIWIALAWVTIWISPRNANLAITLWKDTPFGAETLILTLALTYGVVRPRYWGDRRYWYLIASLVTVLFLTRHNGLLIMVGLWPVVLLVCAKQRQAILPAAVITLAFLIVYRGVILPSLGLDRPDYFRVESNTRNIAALLNQDVAMSQSEYAIIDKVRALDHRWRYLPVFPQAHWGLNRGYALEHLSEYNAVHDSLRARYPQIILRHRLRRISTILSPIPESFEYRMPFEFLSLEYTANAAGIVADSIFPATERYARIMYTKSTHPAFSWFVWRPAIHLYLVLAALVFLLAKTRDLRWALPYVPVLVNTAGIILAAGPHHRYQFPLTFATGFLVCLALIPMSKARSPDPRA